VSGINSDEWKGRAPFANQLEKGKDGSIVQKRVRTPSQACGPNLRGNKIGVRDKRTVSVAVVGEGVLGQSESWDEKKKGRTSSQKTGGENGAEDKGCGGYFEDIKEAMTGVKDWIEKDRSKVRSPEKDPECLLNCRGTNFKVKKGVSGGKLVGREQNEL